ncbi:MAG: GTP cyclohydrolase II, partial [Clostridia bacterium]|nr:GTP cyclohydrolase II [Deltaproteobacteria bacterium]
MLPPATDSSVVVPSLQHLPEVGATFSLTDEKGLATLEVFSRATLPTKFGTFAILVFHNNRDDKEHVALVRGDVRGVEHVPIRVHSECLTGDAFSSLRCDCREQLERAMEMLGRADQGLLLYMRQEGRGIGLGNKIRAYALQEQGLDTVEANEHLGFDDDQRDYAIAALMLKALGVKAVDLVTNNPKKILGLMRHGVEVKT